MQTAASPVTLANNGTGLLVANQDHKLLDADISRAEFTITADTADIWISFGPGAAVVGTGACARAGGLPFTSAFRGEVHIISAGAAKYGFTEPVYYQGEDQGEEPTGFGAYSPGGPSDVPIAAPTAPPPGTPYP